MGSKNSTSSDAKTDYGQSDMIKFSTKKKEKMLFDLLWSSLDMHPELKSLGLCFPSGFPL